MTIIDASVYVTLMNKHEDAYTQCWAWFERAQADQKPIVAPTILLAEVAAALSRGMGEPGLAQRVVQQLEHSKVIDLVPVSLAVAERAATIAAEARIGGCDAVCVALADHLNDTLVTLDRQQSERGSAIVTVREPKGSPDEPT